MRAAVFTLFAVTPFAALPAAAAGQDFRVYTEVSDVTGPAPVPLARSLTLFHAGQAWDHAVEAGEVVRFDPAAAEFVVLDTRRRVACAVSLEEVDRIVTVGRQETEKHIAALARDRPGDPAAAAAAAGLAFSLTPDYAVTDDPAGGGDGSGGGGTLTFAGGPLSYAVRYAAPARPAVASRYADYAAWQARLNFALQPKRHPAARRPIQEALRERGVVPQRVERTTAGPGGAAAEVLLAEHTFQERLDPRDRDLISRWRAALDDPATRKVTFREYQRLTLEAAVQAQTR